MGGSEIGRLEYTTQFLSYAPFCENTLNLFLKCLATSKMFQHLLQKGNEALN